MARRTRTAKALAQRIDMSYFKRRAPLRRWVLLLSMAAPVAALLWIGGVAATGSRAPFSSGPVAHTHAVFGERCERCHVTPMAAFRSHVTDAACLSCHDAPAHKSRQTFTPACASCHVEHRGSVNLSAMDDRFCLQCHQSLKTTDGVPAVASSVGDFWSGHPEFAVRRSNVVNRSGLTFNHAVHMKRDLLGPKGPTTLECTTCHAARDDAPRDHGREAPGRMMAGVTYAAQCASCHTLYFDPLIDAQVPHDTPEVVDAFVVRSLRTFIAANPGQIGKPDPPRGRIPVNYPYAFPSAQAKSADEWVTQRAAAVENHLWQTTCAECHGVGRAQLRPGTPLIRAIVIPPVDIPKIWMPHARFDHRPHRLTTCVTCHRSKADVSTGDIQMPSIMTCQECHKPGANAAEPRCFECHQYHDWPHAKPAVHGFELRQVTN